jgi:hypothetical protein
MSSVVIVLIVLVAALLLGLAFAMWLPVKLRPHRSQGGRPAARMRWRLRRRTPDRP